MEGPSMLLESHRLALASQDVIGDNNHGAVATMAIGFRALTQIEDISCEITASGAFCPDPSVHDMQLTVK